MGANPLVFRAFFCYNLVVNVHRLLWRTGLVLAGLLLLGGGFGASAKPIRLRNGFISTTSNSLTAEISTNTAPVSGLYLIQFTGPVKPVWRSQLAADGVDLIKHVPDNAFVARLNNVPLAGLGKLAYVQWVGEYRAGYKLHPQLKALAAQFRGASAPLEVNVVVSPKATPQELAGVRRLFTNVRQDFHRPSIGILRGQTTRAQLNALADSSAVLWIEPVVPMKLFDETAADVVGGAGGLHQTFTQSLGYTGTNVIVSVMDSGLCGGSDDTLHPDLAGHVMGWLYYGSLTNASDQYGHGTHVAGLIAGNGATGETDTNGTLYGLSIAPSATLLVQRIFDANGVEQSVDYGGLTQDAVRAGAVIGSASWGNDTALGGYDSEAAKFDALVRDADSEDPGDQPYILVFAAGNTGPGSQTIASPATAKNIIAVGAAEGPRTNFSSYTDGPEEMADFSARGPCADGRIKPDLVAPGTWASSLASAAAVTNIGTVIDSNYFYLNGTSQAAPQVSGAAAAFVQYYEQMFDRNVPSPALVKAALVNSAHALKGNDLEPVPNQDEGWGRVNLAALLGPGRAYDFVDQTVLLTTGQNYQRSLLVNSSTKPLIVTMAYTDPPGIPGVVPSLVNDLDLEVISPSGQVYFGNQFDGNGNSVPNAGTTDSTNNVEQIYLPSPAPGEYVVEVIGTDVAEDARDDTPAVDQDFALAISGDIPPAGQATAFLDRQFYTAPDQIQIKVIDPNQGGDASVTCFVTSTTETNPVGVTLSAADDSGTFTGMVATATGPVLTNGLLYVNNADVISMAYFDAVIGTNVYATATVDLVPPAVTNVTVTTSFGRTFVSSQSSEPATVVINYGTTTNLNQSATNLTFSPSQTVPLPGLAPGETYYFQVVATDQAGNVATNDNGGAFYSFVAITPSTVLLVDSYVPDSQSANIPLSTYTNALNQTGISYDVWSVLQLGAPTPDILQPYQVVIWRISDSWTAPMPYSTLTGSQQTMIQNYLNGGGSFMMASMQILKLINNTAFASNVLQVAQYNANPDYEFSYCGECDEACTVPQILGNNSDPVTAGVNMTLNYSAYPSDSFLGIGPDIADTFTPAASAEPIIFTCPDPSVDTNFDRVCGMRYPRTGQQSAGRAVFLSFPLDAVPAFGTSPSDAGDFLRNLLDFLAPNSTILLDAPAYPQSGAAAVEVDDAAAAGQGTVTITATNLTTPAGVTLGLQETVRPGVFQGYVYLEPVTNPPAEDTLPVQDKDVIQVQYFDNGAQTLLTANAVIIANPPAISNVVATPDYEDATIGWITSDPADTEVQYGQTVFFGGTAYQSVLTTNHLVGLGNLTPGTTYYFRVISHDAAGNTAVDDNNGALYTFTTPQPLLPPWSDNLEGEVTNWLVHSSANSQSTWTLGTPDNTLATSAHSPTNAWGSNLGGNPVNFAITSLMSPAVLLTNGNVATLNFWQDYNFSENAGSVLSQGGALFVSTNAFTAPVPLKTYPGASAGWQPDQVDLTPFIGQVVRLIWQYQVSSVNPAAHPGWLVDDVSITVSNLTTGTIQITNNLWESIFALNGPVSLNGLGTSTVITNAPPGQYVITYGGVPFYQTPLPQTNTLAPGATLTFQGSYTFADANRNGIADAWEMFYFGNISSNRTDQTDTLGNGMSDYAKFIAGLNPTNPASLLQLTPTVVSNATAIELDWDTFPAHAYQIVGSPSVTNGNWTPLTGWIQATSGAESYTLPSTNQMRFFRVLVEP